LKKKKKRRGKNKKLEKRKAFNLKRKQRRRLWNPGSEISGFELGKTTKITNFSRNSCYLKVGTKTQKLKQLIRVKTK